MPPALALRAHPAPSDGLRIMVKRDIGVRVPRQLGHQADLDTLGLQRRYEAVMSAVGRYGG
jgi:hypothetical protein